MLGHPQFATRCQPAFPGLLDTGLLGLDPVGEGLADLVAELVEIGAGIGRPVVERTTTYERR